MAWVAREHQERFVFRLQILDPPGISSSRAAASRGSVPAPPTGDGRGRAVQPRCEGRGWPSDRLTMP